MSSIGFSKEIIQLNKIDNVFAFLDRYSKGDQLKLFENIEDPYLRLLTVINELLSVNLMLRESEGLGTRNIGFTGRNGTEYDSGLSPESIADVADREDYKKVVAVNRENIRTRVELSEIRKSLLGLLKSANGKVDKKYQQVTALIIDKS